MIVAVAVVVAVAMAMTAEGDAARTGISAAGTLASYVYKPCIGIWPWHLPVVSMLLDLDLGHGKRFSCLEDSEFAGLAGCQSPDQHEDCISISIQYLQEPCRYNICSSPTGSYRSGKITCYPHGGQYAHRMQHFASPHRLTYSVLYEAVMFCQNSDFIPDGVVVSCRVVSIQVFITL